MRTTTYCISPQIEAFAAKSALEKMFKSATYIELTDENSHDRCWHKFEAEGPQKKYKDLNMQEMAWLLEQHVANILEDILWGHEFKVEARMHKRGPVYEANVWMDLIRGVNDRWKYTY